MDLETKIGYGLYTVGPTVGNHIDLIIVEDVIFNYKIGEKGYEVMENDTDYHVLETIDGILVDVPILIYDGKLDYNIVEPPEKINIEIDYNFHNENCFDYDIDYLAKVKEVIDDKHFSKSSLMGKSGNDEVITNIHIVGNRVLIVKINNYTYERYASFDGLHLLDGVSLFWKLEDRQYFAGIGLVTNYETDPMERVANYINLFGGNKPKNPNK